MNVVAFIFARGGSKGIIGKNIKDFAGKPLIAWSIEHALSVSQINRVIVSTDSQEIAAVALTYGAEVPFMRPSALASDNSPEWLSWQHALQYLQDSDGFLPDAMVSVPATAPLRLPLDIEHCIREYAKEEIDIVLTTTDASHNPYFNMVSVEPDGRVGLLMASSSNGVQRRQGAPNVYGITTVAYVANPQFIMSKDGIFSGRVRAVYIPPERAIDIDTLLDFEIAEFLMYKKRV